MVTFIVEFYGPKGWEIARESRGLVSPRMRKAKQYSYAAALTLLEQTIRDGFDARLTIER